MKTDIKHWTLEVVASSRSEFKALLSSVPNHERKGVGKLKQWSAKDEIAHLGYWLEIFVKNLKARRNGKALIDTRDYLAINDNAWEQRKDWSWAEVEEKVLGAFAELEKQIKALSLEQLTEESVFTLEPDRSSPRPLIKSLLYELIDHPLHHATKFYQKFGETAKAREMLLRVEQILKQPGVSTWTATSKSKIQKFRNRLNV